MIDTASICFTGLLGQEKAKRLFSRSLMAGRIPHALLFRGPDGVGKRLFAEGVAATINCRKRSGVMACGKCSSCKKFRSQNHPDFMMVRPIKGVVKIEQIRQLAKELSYPPFESETRIVVLEDVHTMRREAANSLLKLLEEPPPDNLLILTAESSQEILPTLMSRCQVIPFTQLSTEDTAAILVAHGIDSEAAQLLARLSEGSPGRALLFQKSEMVGVWREVEQLFAKLQKINRAERELARNCNRNLVCEILLFGLQ